MNPRVRPRNEVVGDIRAFLEAAESLPTPQGTALRIIELARDPDAGLEDIVRVIQTDPALTGFVLRAASAARFYNMRGTASVQHAVQRLGLNAIRSYALVLSLINQSRRLECAAFDYDRFWVGSLHTGILTESLAMAAHHQSADDTFALGLLGNVGMLAFATAQPAEYARVLAVARYAKTELAPLEREVFGFDHHELAAVMLVDWGLPTSTADIVYWHRDPEGGGFAPGSTPYLLACIVRLARSASNYLLDPDEADAHLANMHLRAAVIELEAEILHEVVASSVDALREWTRLIGMSMPTISAQRLAALA